MRPLPLLVAAAAPLLVACGGFPAPPMPAPAAYRPAAVSDAQAWSSESAPTERTLIRFKWVYRDGSNGAKGSGAIRLSAPDSLRLDFRGPLGQGRGAAAVVAARTLWADPADQVDKFVPNFQLLWGMLGTALAPAPGATVLSAGDERVTAWRYIAGADTTDYLRTRVGASQMLTDVRSGGVRIGRVLTTFDAAGKPVKARLDVPSGPARLDVDFTSITTTDAHPEGTWDVPVDDQ